MGETQEALPGMERRDLPEIEQAAENYRKIRNQRCELSKKEAEAKAALIQAMKNKGRSYYSYNGLNVQLRAVESAVFQLPVSRSTAHDSAPGSPHPPSLPAPLQCTCSQRSQPAQHS